MLDLEDLKVFIQDAEMKLFIDSIWDTLGETFTQTQLILPPEMAMPPPGTVDSMTT